MFCKLPPKHANVKNRHHIQYIIHWAPQIFIGSPYGLVIFQYLHKKVKTLLGAMRLTS